jgi:hypothetical protein
MRLPFTASSFRLLLGALALAATGAAAHGDATLRPAVLTTRSDVVLDAAVFVERTRLAAKGPVHTLEPARRLGRGDRVVTLLTWYRLGGNGGFVVTNALPATLAFQPDDRDEDVSADGGHTWGRLGTLRYGARFATAEDVTHVRWHVTPAQAMAGSGRIAYAGLVK